MKYKDRSGNLIERETGQDRFLKKLYTKAIGRFFVRILITRPVTLVCGFFLNRRISAAFIKGFIKNNNIEILHCHLFRSQFFGYIIKRYFFPDIKLIFHEHGPLSERFEGFITKMFLRYSRNILDKSIAVSEMMKRLLIDSGKIECTKISILPNFIFPEYFKENKDKNREEFRKKHNLSDDTFVVG